MLDLALNGELSQAKKWALRPIFAENCFARLYLTNPLGEKRNVNCRRNVRN